MPEYTYIFKNAYVQQKKPISDNGILLSGCQTNETSADVGPEDGDGKSCGAFSHSLQTVLAQHPGVITNKELVTKARELLGAEGFEQHPCLYCSDANAEAPFLLEEVQA
jgi:metacaspase-1